MLKEQIQRLLERNYSSLQERWKFIVCDDGAPMIATEGDVLAIPELNHTQPDKGDLLNFQAMVDVQNFLYDLNQKGLDSIS